MTIRTLFCFSILSILLCSCSKPKERANAALFVKFHRQQELDFKDATYAMVDDFAIPYFTEKGEAGTMEEFESAMNAYFEHEKVNENYKKIIARIVPQEEQELRAFALFCLPSQEGTHSLWEQDFRERLAKDVRMQGISPQGLDTVAFYFIHQDKDMLFFQENVSPTRRQEAFNGFFEKRLSPEDLAGINSAWEENEIIAYKKEQEALAAAYKERAECMQRVVDAHKAKHKKTLQKIVSEFQRKIDSRELSYNRITRSQYDAKIKKNTLGRIQDMRQQNDDSSEAGEEYEEVMQTALRTFPNSIAGEVPEYRVTPFLRMRGKLANQYRAYAAIERELMQKLYKEGCIGEGINMFKYTDLDDDGFKKITFANMLMYCGK